MNDPYSVLGLVPGASPDDIKVAFRRLAKQYHPDLNPNNPEAEAKFKELTAAYEALTNPKPNPPPHREQGGWEETIFDSPFGAFHFNGNARQFEEMLRAQAAMQRARMPNRNFTTTVGVSLEQLFEGCEVDIQINASTSNFQIKIPKGISEYQRIRIQGGGGRENPNMPPGDLFVMIRQIPHPRFSRDGDDLICSVTINSLEAMVGTRLSVKGIDGQNLDVQIPSGIQYGEEVIVSGHGMPVYSQPTRGDLRLSVEIKTLRSLDEEHRDLVEALIKKLPKGP